MASITIASDERGLYAQALAASVVDTVTLTASGRRSTARVEVSGDGTAAIYFTIDGSTPTVKGKKTYELPAAVAAREVTAHVEGDSDVVVKLISAGTPSYSVARIS